MAAFLAHVWHLLKKTSRIKGKTSSSSCRWPKQTVFHPLSLPLLQNIEEKRGCDSDQAQQSDGHQSCCLQCDAGAVCTALLWADGGIHACNLQLWTWHWSYTSKKILSELPGLSPGHHKPAFCCKGCSVYVTLQYWGRNTFFRTQQILCSKWNVAIHCVINRCIIIPTIFYLWMPARPGNIFSMDERQQQVTLSVSLSRQSTDWHRFPPSERKPHFPARVA